MSIKIMINGRVMKSGPFFLFFLFLTACLLIPVLPNRSENQGKKETTSSAAPVVSLAQNNPQENTVSPIVPNQSADESQSTSKNQATPTEGPSPSIAVGPVTDVTTITAGTTDTVSIVPTEEPNPAEFHEVALSSETGESAEISPDKNLFIEVASPYISEENRPKPITMRGNLPATPGSREFVQAPQPLQQRVTPAASAPTAQATPVSPLPTATPRDYAPIAPTSFDTIKPRPVLPDFLREPNKNTYNDLFDYMTEALRQSVAYARPAVVHIEARVHKPNRGTKEYEETGGGVLALLQNRFFVITNGHVAGDPVSLQEVHILLANQKTIHPIRVLTCPDIDIALLEVSGTDLPTTVLQPGAEVTVARFGDSDKVEIPDTVLTIGSPFGLAGSVSKGIVGGLERRKIPLGSSPDQIQNFIQTDAPINPGNSGGPLLNTSGEVIGIVTAIASSSGKGEGVGLALPINSVLRVATQLVADGVYRRPYMGVELDPKFGEQERQNYGLIRPVGTRVLQITPGSPADKVGLRQGDVILTYNGTVVQDDQHLVQLISLSKVGDAPQISVLRDRQEVYLTPLLGGGTATAAK